MSQQNGKEKTDWREALSVYGKTVLCTVLSLLLYLSTVAVCTALFTNAVGERVYPLDENGNYILDENGEAIYELVYFEDKTESDAPAENADGKQPQFVTITEYGEMHTGAKWTMNIVLTLLLGGILTALVYATVWSIGDKDSNRVAFGRRREDRYRGFKIGCLASVPSAVLFAVYVLASVVNADGAAFYTMVYGWLNAPFLPILSGIGTLGSAAVRYVLTALLLLYVPLVAHVAYSLGYRQISIWERIVYTTKKQ